MLFCTVGASVVCFAAGESEHNGPCLALTKLLTLWDALAQTASNQTSHCANIAENMLVHCVADPFKGGYMLSIPFVPALCFYQPILHGHALICFGCVDGSCVGQADACNWLLAWQSAKNLKPSSSCLSSLLSGGVPFSKKSAHGTTHLFWNVGCASTSGLFSLLFEAWQLPFPLTTTIQQWQHL